MKSMDSFVRLGANRSHSRRYGENLQPRLADEDAISCKRFGETQYQYCVSPMSLQIKSMDSFVRLGANRSHSRRYGEDLQPRLADGDAISCKRFGETQY